MTLSTLTLRNLDNEPILQFFTTSLRYIFVRFLDLCPRKYQRPDIHFGQIRFKNRLKNDHK